MQQTSQHKRSLSFNHHLSYNQYSNPNASHVGTLNHKQMIDPNLPHVQMREKPDQPAPVAKTNIKGENLPSHSNRTFKLTIVVDYVRFSHHLITYCWNNSFSLEICFDPDSFSQLTISINRYLSFTMVSLFSLLFSTINFYLKTTHSFHYSQLEYSQFASRSTITSHIDKFEFVFRQQWRDFSEYEKNPTDLRRRCSCIACHRSILCRLSKSISECIALRLVDD